MIDVSAFWMVVGRRTPWAALCGVVLVCGVATALWSSVNDGIGELLLVLRLDALAVAAVTATCLEDGAEELTASAPVGMTRRRLASVALTGVMGLASWLAIAVPAGLTSDRSNELPWVGLLIEVAALTSVGWVLAAMVTATWGWRGSGVRATAAVSVLTVCTVFTPRTMDWLWSGPSPAWRMVHVRWSVIGLVSFAGFLLLSRDPARRQILAPNERRKLPA